MVRFWLLQPLRDDPERRNVGGFLPIISVLVPLALLGIVGLMTWRAAWIAAESEMRRSALAAAEYGKRTFEGFAVAVGRVNDRLRGMTDEEISANELELGQELQGIIRELTQSALIFVIGRDGYPLIATNIYPVPEGVSLADREYYQALLADPAPDQFISRTFIGRFDGQLLFSVSRRRSDTGNPPTPDGFDGVVLISVNPSVLAEGLDRLMPSPTDRLALMRADGYGISTTSGNLDTSQPLPRVDPSSPFYDYANAGVESAFYVSFTATPGSASLLAMQAVEGLPLYAVSIRPRSQVVAAWWAAMSPILGFGLPATLALFLLGLRVARDQKSLAAANAALQSENVLSSNRLGRAMRFGLVGTYEFDILTGESRRSPEYMSIHGFPALAKVETHDDWARRLHPDDRQRAEAELFRVLADGSGESLYGQTYRIINARGETRWIAAQGEIERDSGGKAVMLRGVHVDITPLRTTEIALAESDARLRLAQEAMGIGTWEWVGWSQPMRASPRFMELMGMDPSAEPPQPRAALARVHGDDRAILATALRRLRSEGTFRVEVRIDGPSSAPVWVAMWAKVMSAPLPGGLRVIGIAYDISERKRAEEMKVLMAHEVEHRAKNALTVVSSLLRMSSAPTAEDLVKVMNGRVRALGQTMALLGKSGWAGASLKQIIDNELSPFVASTHGDGFDIDVSGPHVQIGVDVAQPLSMAIHELATNAAKYGALSVPKGRVSVIWSLAADNIIHLVWREEGGPAVDSATTHAGFGSRLISMLFEGQMGGRVNKRWEPDGLVCEMVFPLRAKGEMANGPG